jgi:hypothetical protein
MYASMAEQPKRRTRAKRNTSAVTYRILKLVKEVISHESENSGKSENKQAEYLLMIGILVTKGIKLSDFSDVTVLQKFNEFIREIDKK